MLLGHFAYYFFNFENMRSLVVIAIIDIIFGIYFFIKKYYTDIPGFWYHKESGALYYAYEHEGNRLCLIRQDKKPEYKFVSRWEIYKEYEKYV